ncbi:ABC transporter G family member 13 [Camellia lanceoleosa]|uniref:ABC transporter G family member 13 n=1 Tax=Camellia lanceoleosa TaxID=1840588 RepID=A0ACC0F3B2_9ERIC|nr:ABC transporter G family member 13 [Camellia lanceoleosa]
MSKEKINGIIEGTLTEMGLQDCADHLIGNWHLRGISGGEKKRLSIALEILTRPHHLFLDEPTSGLDSTSAFFVTQILKNIAHNGRTVIFSIHQPSSEVFALFDDLDIWGRNCLLWRSKDGSGGNRKIIKPYDEFGNSRDQSMLVKKYKCSKHAARARARVQEISTIGVMMMTAGFFRFLTDLPKPFWRYPMSYINYMAWALQGVYKNDMIGLEFDPLQPGDPKLKGKAIINTVLGISLDHSKWWDLTVVIVILIVYRLLFFTILKFKERASPVFRTIYTKRTLHHLCKRPSFRKTPPFPSQKHQVMHSLSPQEGLNSPIH